MNKPELSVIIVSYNVRQLLLECIATVINTCQDSQPQIILVDNASSDGSVEIVKKQFPRVRVIANSSNTGFAAANNQGCEIAEGEYLLLLNPDTVVKPGAIGTVLKFMQCTPDAGMAACRLLNGDGSLQRSVKRLPTAGGNLIQSLYLDRLFFNENHGEFYYRDKPFRIGYPSGAFMMVRRSSLEGMPLLNERYFMYAEEKDLAIRLKQKGYCCYFVPDAEIIHYGGKSTGQMALPMFLELQKSQVKYFKTYFTGFDNWLIVWSYWLMLVTHFSAAACASFTKYGRHRLKLFYHAVVKYPRFVNA